MLAGSKSLNTHTSLTIDLSEDGLDYRPIARRSGRPLKRLLDG